MSAIYYQVTDEAALVATDTYSIRADTGRALTLTDKCIPIPHLSMVLTGTGFHGFLMEWYWTIQRQTAAVDIEHLNEMAPGLLQETWLRFQDKNNLPDRDAVPGSGGVTISHLGYSEREEQFAGCYYKLEDDFAPTRVKPGQQYFMPDLEGVTDAFQEGLDAQQQAAALFVRAKDLDEERPPGERLGIGGMVKYYAVGRHGHVCKDILEFDDREETKEQILEANQREDVKTLAV